MVHNWNGRLGPELDVVIDSWYFSYTTVYSQVFIQLSELGHRGENESILPLSYRAPRTHKQTLQPHTVVAVTNESAYLLHTQCTWNAKLRMLN